MGCMATSHFTFHLENDSALFNPLITYLQEAVSQMGLYGDDEQMRMGVALDEALANALYHGNLEIGSELRDDPDAMCALIEDRRRQSPYCDRRLHVEVSLSHEEIKFIVGDEGPGFDPNSLPDPTDPANLEKVSGRGILLMRTFMDEVTFNPTGNVVKMVKHIKKHHALTS
jgi:anti-sigma regulatory factor (Ser/Thr protein kinase)